MHFMSDDLSYNASSKLLTVSVPKAAFTIPGGERPFMPYIVIQSHKTGNREEFAYECAYYDKGKATTYVWFNRKHGIHLKMNLDG